MIGIEKDAVRHKMIKDDVDGKVVHAVVGSETHDSSTVEPKTTVAALAETRQRKDGPTLSLEEESVASNYRKMLKIQVPKDMVLSRMRQDGVSDKIIEAVVGPQSLNAKQTGESKEPSANASKLVSLHWTPLSGTELDHSLWRVNSVLEDLDAQPERNDVSKLVALFQKKTNQGRTKDKATAVDSSNTRKARLLDLTRSNNVAISLKAFKDFSYKDLADVIAFLDPSRKVTGERIHFLRDLLPTAAELDTIRAFDGPEDRLLPAELWFRQIMNIQRIDAKVQVMQTMETFNSEAESLRDNFRLLCQVCNQVMDSDKLVFLLGKVLRIGNIMNEGTRTGGAAGFKFDSLLRLTQTKSSDNKVTVLDFLVTSLVDQGQRETLDLLSDFPECQNASRIAIGDLLNDAKELKERLNKCEEELHRLRDDTAGRKPKGRMKLGSETGSTSTASSMSSNAALLSAILSRAKSSDPPQKKEGFPQRDHFLAMIKEKASESENQLSSSGPDTSNAEEALASSSAANDENQNSIKRAIGRLERFLVDGKSAFEELEMARSEAERACNDLSRFCGESGGTSAISPLLYTLATFATSLHDALKAYDAKREADLRTQYSSTLSDSATVATKE
jgi:hypothetical protein